MIKRCLCCGARLDTYNLSGLCYNCFCEVQKINELQFNKRKEYEKENEKYSDDYIKSKLIDNDTLKEPYETTNSTNLNLLGTEYEKLLGDIIEIDEIPSKFDNFTLEISSDKEPQKDVPLSDDWYLNW